MVCKPQKNTHPPRARQPPPTSTSLTLGGVRIGQRQPRLFGGRHSVPHLLEEALHLRHVSAWLGRPANGRTDSLSFASGNDRLCDTTERASQRLTHARGRSPCITEVGRTLHPTTLMSFVWHYSGRPPEIEVGCFVHFCEANESTILVTNESQTTTFSQNKPIDKNTVQGLNEVHKAMTPLQSEPTRQRQNKYPHVLKRRTSRILPRARNLDVQNVVGVSVCAGTLSCFAFGGEPKRTHQNQKEPTIFGGSPYFATGPNRFLIWPFGSH